MSRDPALAAELADFKRHQAELNRQAREEATPAMQLAPVHAIESAPSAAANQSDTPAKCWHCGGARVVEAMFGSRKNDCYVCEATGYDLSDPVAVIRLLVAGGRKLRLQLQAERRELRELRELIGEEEIQRRRERAWVEKHRSRFD